MGLCLAALLVIVVSMAFTGWRLGWLSKANPEQVIHHPVSDLDAAKAPVTARKPPPRAAAAKPKPAPRLSVAAPAADIQSKKTSAAFSRHKHLMHSPKRVALVCRCDPVLIALLSPRLFQTEQSALHRHLKWNESGHLADA